MFELKTVNVAVMLVVEVYEHGFPVIAAGPDLVDYLGVLVEFVHLCEVSLDEVEVQFDLLDLSGLSLKGVNGGKNLSDFGEHFFHFLGSYLGLIELYGVEANG